MITKLKNYKIYRIGTGLQIIYLMINLKNSKNGLKRLINYQLIIHKIQQKENMLNGVKYKEKIKKIIN